MKIKYNAYNKKETFFISTKHVANFNKLSFTILSINIQKKKKKIE